MAETLGCVAADSGSAKDGSGPSPEELRAPDWRSSHASSRTSSLHCGQALAATQAVIFGALRQACVRTKVEPSHDRPLEDASNNTFTNSTCKGSLYARRSFQRLAGVGFITTSANPPIIHADAVRPKLYRYLR